MSIWDRQDVIDRFKELLGEHLAFSVIAATINREFGTCLTRNALIGKAHRLGLPAGQPRLIPKLKTTSKQRLSSPPTSSSSPPPSPSPPPPIETYLHRCTIFELTNKTCRWPLGPPLARAEWFCGAPADLAARSPYCPEHSRL